ncbi:MAG TPA: transglutaminase domain-containing protein [Verrucomicrobiae bacterium]|jgi:hypothetical protein|nr:transglutaminase domain-containing protein [Verrucomicrobiae bacterium]
MRTPPLLLGAALFFWGWQTGHLWLSAGMGAALEGARWWRRRWDFSAVDLQRIWMLCLALQAGAALILYSTQDRMLFVFKFAQSLPMSFLPLMLAQVYGMQEAMPATIFFWPFHRKLRSDQQTVHVSFPYFALCVVGTSASTQANGYFFEGMAILLLAALSWSRPRRVGIPVWAALSGMVVVMGFYSQQELRRFQTALEGALGGWIADMLHQPADARECRTQIGHAGEISLSGRIIWRVTPDDSGFSPSLLRQAVYDGYRNQTWTCSSNDYSPAASAKAETYNLLPSKPIEFDVRVAGYYQNGEGPLALPHGVFELKDVATPAAVQTNRLGCAALDNAPGLVECTARWGPGPSLDPPPGILDTNVSENERPVLAKIASELGLKNLNDRQKIRAVARFFADNFRYSLNISDRQEPGKTPLGVFLTTTKEGHCEYFATATVLLLRQAGVPARYVTGYAVPDNARQGKTFLVRERHAHAWALAYHSDNHSWEEVDTTPPVWADKSAAPPPPWWEPMSDMGSNFYFRFSEWRWSKTSLARYASWLMAPLILSLVWRIIADQRGRAAARGQENDAPPDWPGLDSELYQIDRRLEATALARHTGETLGQWQARLEASGTAPQPIRLRRIFALHRSLRFDPHGLSAAERRALADEAARWLADFAVENPRAKTGRLKLS